VNNYSNANLETLKKDLDKTIEECKKLIEHLKKTPEVKLDHFNNIESMIYDLSR